MDVQALSLYGYPIFKRIDEITRKIKTTNKIFPMEIMGKQEELPVISARIEMPVYRLTNGRTRSSQLEYLSTHPDIARDLFTRDQDAFDAQFTQHQLLKELVAEEDLLDIFQKDREQQTQPILCTDTGVVVNGNRRLCAWRELYYNNKEQYKHFETINIAILTNYDDKAISDIEKTLQIQKTHRAEYRWHTKALMAQEDLQNAQDAKQVAKSYDMSEKEMRTLIDARTFAEEYLKRINAENQWSRVDKKYYAFDSIVKGSKKISNQNERELFEKLAFDLITENQDEMVEKPSGRLYTSIMDYANNIHAISQELAIQIEQQEKMVGDYEDNVSAQEEQNKVESLPNQNASLSIDQDEDIDILAGEENIEIDDASKVSYALDSGTVSSDIHSAIKSVIDTQKELQDEKDKSSYLLHKLSKIAGDLQSAITNGLVENVKLDGIDKQIDAIREKLNYIETWIGDKK